MTYGNGTDHDVRQVESIEDGLQGGGAFGRRTIPVHAVAFTVLLRAICPVED